MDMSDIMFLNPTENLLPKIKNYILGLGYKLAWENGPDKRYVKEEKEVGVGDYEDPCGKLIIVISWGIDNHTLREILRTCPECGSDKIKVIMWFDPWRNAVTDQLADEDKLVYGPMIYDRFGTRPPTRICKNCGCEWYNNADIEYWSSIVKSGRELTKEDLGINE